MERGGAGSRSWTRDLPPRVLAQFVAVLADGTVAAAGGAVGPADSAWGKGARPGRRQLGARSPSLVVLIGKDDGPGDFGGGLVSPPGDAGFAVGVAP